MNSKLIKILGIVATVVGTGATLLSGWVEDKKLDEKINTKVTEAFANFTSKDEL